MKKALPEFLAMMAMVLPGFLASEATAGEIKINRPATVEFEIAGGGGANAWHIQYGTPTTGSRPKLIALPGPGTTAYFSHGVWLRRIDTERGVVTGRWRFPGTAITALTAKDDHLQLEVEEQGPENRSFRRVLEFNPDDDSNQSRIPFWPGFWFYLAPSQSEMNCFCNLPNLKPEQARRWLPEAENAALRDPLSPWLRVALAHVYKALDKAEADNLLDDAAVTGPADFGELFRLSATLDSEGHPAAARQAFERGYEDFWRKGNDPRFVSSLFARIFTYSLPPGVLEQARPELIERLYKVGPWVEGADYAWAAYATALKNTGDFQEAQKWSQRAAEARTKSLFPLNPTLQKSFVIATVLVAAAGLACFLYFLTAFVRYFPERRIHPESTFFNVDFWNWRDRIQFLTIVLIGWLSAGVMGSLVTFTAGTAAVPIGVMSGSFAGPVTIAHFENLPATPDRDLLLAMAYHQDGQLPKAEALYRNLPQYPESWNNLGSLLKDSGRLQEARQAFDRALELDAGMSEARLNLGNAPSDLWTELHRTYLPDRGMLTPPKPERVRGALGIGSTSQIAAHSLFGPLELARGLERFARLRSPAPRLFIPLIALVVILLIILVTACITRPVRDVTQAPPPLHTILALLLPGTGAAWRYLGGITLTMWTFAALQLLLLTTRPRLPLSPFVSSPMIRRAFGVPLSSGVSPSDISSIGLPLPAILGLLFALYGVNFLTRLRATKSKV